MKKAASQGICSASPTTRHDVFEIGVAAAGVADHLVGDVDADDAAFGNVLGEQAGEPACAAADVEHVVVRLEPHAVEHGEDDGQVILLHALAAPGFGPAVEFLAELFVLCGFGHGAAAKATTRACGSPAAGEIDYMPVSSAEGP